MSDPNDPRADARVDALLDGLAPGDPLAEEVERLLAEGGPVPVDPRDLDRAAASLAARLAPPAPRRRVPRAVAALAAAAALCVVAAGSWWAGREAGRSAPDPVEAAAVAAPRVGHTEVARGPGALAEIRGEVVELVDGVVSVTRHDPRAAGPHAVHVAGLELTVEPVGTVYAVGSRDAFAAVWVREGRVALMHRTQGHLGEVGAGTWALVRRTAAGIQVHRVPDGPLDPAQAGLGDDDAALLAEMRWLMLPEAAREAILPPGDAP